MSVLSLIAHADSAYKSLGMGESTILRNTFDIGASFGASLSGSPDDVQTALKTMVMCVDMANHKS